MANDGASDVITDSLITAKSLVVPTTSVESQ